MQIDFADRTLLFSLTVPDKSVTKSIHLIQWAVSSAR